MTRQLDVHFLPTLIPPRAVVGSAVVVIDVLRASTTIAAALDAGASDVVPCLDVDDARRIAAESTCTRPLLGGERGGERIAGFDLGNSPLEYTTQRVAGRRIVFTTTNGTRALLAAGDARRIVVGAFVNVSAVADALAAEEKIDLVCAGTNGEVTAEDVLLAGLLAERLATADASLRLGDTATLARQGWQQTAAAVGDKSIPTSLVTALVAALRQSTGGQNLLALGMDADIEYAAQIDRHP
ncbi:MAG: 2-phosphosulfolactate phosphatase, partial [Planctomycetales bacterium]|nr:2-phosphosulfolactate phosphatase [Planctomycetales bacterium]